MQSCRVASQSYKTTTKLSNKHIPQASNNRQLNFIQQPPFAAKPIYYRETKEKHLKCYISFRETSTPLFNISNHKDTFYYLNCMI